MIKDLAETRSFGSLWSFQRSHLWLDAYSRKTKGLEAFQLSKSRGRMPKGPELEGSGSYAKNKA
jgi:hypothetical protein